MPLRRRRWRRSRTQAPLRRWWRSRARARHRQGDGVVRCARAVARRRNLRRWGGFSTRGPCSHDGRATALRVARHPGCRLARRRVPRLSLNASRAFRGHVSLFSVDAVALRANVASVSSRCGAGLAEKSRNVLSRKSVGSFFGEMHDFSRADASEWTYRRGTGDRAIAKGLVRSMSITASNESVELVECKIVHFGIFSATRF